MKELRLVDILCTSILYFFSGCLIVKRFPIQSTEEHTFVFADIFSSKNHTELVFLTYGLPSFVVVMTDFMCYIDGKF